MGFYGFFWFGSKSLELAAVLRQGGAGLDVSWLKVMQKAFTTAYMSYLYMSFLCFCQSIKCKTTISKNRTDSLQRLT